jgi:hypothetical protein
MGARALFVFEDNKDALCRVRGANQPEYIGQAFYPRRRLVATGLAYGATMLRMLTTTDDNAYAQECYIRRYWVINRYGHRVLRRGYVC